VFALHRSGTHTLLEVQCAQCLAEGIHEDLVCRGDH